MRIRPHLTTAFAFYSSTRSNKLRGGIDSIIPSFPSVFGQEIVSPVTRNTVSQSALNMGAGKAAAEVILKDFSGEALGWFGGIRIPASLIVGSSLGALFTMSGKLKDATNQSKAEYVLLQLHQALILVSFVLSLNSVVFATAANVEVMHRSFDPVARSSYSLLKREFEYPFVTIRLGFLTSLIVFIQAVIVRGILEFGALEKVNKNLAIGLAFIGISLSTHLLSYVNSTLICWGNILPMAAYWFKLVLARATSGKYPLQTCSLIFGWGGMFLYLKHVIHSIRLKLKSD